MASSVVTVHLAALGLYIASCLYLLLVLLPSAVLAADARIQRRRLAAAFRILNPAAIGALGILLVTGAVRLTDIKAGLGPTFFAQIGLPLAAKLTLAFLVINIATYVAFGCGLRIVRAHQGDLPVDAPWQRRMLVRIAVATCLALGLTVLAIRVSMGIGGILRTTAPAPHAGAPDALPSDPDRHALRLASLEPNEPVDATHLPLREPPRLPSPDCSDPSPMVR
jgi:uncharacterized membrane protein